MGAAREALPVAKRLLETVPKEFLEDARRSSLKKRTGVSLNHMMSFRPTPPTLVHSARFLHRELPIRFAHRITELDTLPWGLSDLSPFIRVRDRYFQSFIDIRNHPDPATPELDASFTRVISQVLNRHRNTVPLMAAGVAKLKQRLHLDNPWLPMEEYPEVHHFLDRFLLSRIGLRMLMGQHVALHIPDPDPDYVGLICTRCNPLKVAQEAIEDARALCLRTYGTAPEVKVFGDPSFTFAYVPSHLHHMIFELVKNSLRAVQDKYSEETAGGGSDKAPPPVRVVVADGIEDVTIKISDEGGGIPRSGLPRIWTYLYSTAELSPQHSSILEDADLEEKELPTVIAGFGYGLPMSRLYARYFGGDLQIYSMDGYGTDAYLHLNRLSNVQEPLP